jgi:uncharacterized protein
MKKIYLILLSFLILTNFTNAQEIKFPKPKGYVNDYVGIINSQDKAYLENLLANIQRKTTAEIAVVTIQTIQPYDIELYAVKLFEKWGIGKKGKDNGILLLIAFKDRKLRIEVGYGLEGALPDAICKQIITNSIIPYFKKGNYSKGIVSGVNQIVKYVSQEYGINVNDIKNYKPVSPPPSRGIGSFILYLLLFLLIFGLRSGFLFFFLPFGGGYWSGGRGGFGGGFGGFGGGMSGGGGASGGW